MAVERSEFYPNTIHVIFAVVVATSFTLAEELMIPFDSALEPKNLVSAIILALAYLMVILGWVGHARSATHWKYEDTRFGAARFAVHIPLLFAYFYLLQIAPTEHAGQFTVVLVVLAGMYVVSEIITYLSQLHQQRAQIAIRIAHAVTLLILTTFVALLFDWFLRWGVIVAAFSYPQLQEYDSTAVHLPSIVVCVGLVVWYRLATWKMDEADMTQRHEDP